MNENPKSDCSCRRPAAWVVLVTALPTLTLCAGCSRNTDAPKPTAFFEKIRARTEGAVSFAHENGCVLLREEIQKVVGTNRFSVRSLDVQRVLDTHKHFVSTGRLVDVVQSGERVEAIFEISDLDLDVFLHQPSEVVSRLECPTNLIATLTTNGLGEVCFAFEVAHSTYTANFTTRPAGDDDSVVLSGIITITGKLIALKDLKEFDIPASR